MADKSYNTYKDIDFSIFEPTERSFDRNAARQAQPQRRTQRPAPKLEIVRRQRKTVSQAKEEMRNTAIQSAKVIAVALILLSMFSALLYGRFKVDELDREISSLNSEISTAQSENVRLNMEIDSVISLKNVEDYAQTKLGMVKMENHQIEYIDLSGEDRVVLSGGKTLRADGKSFLSKVMEYISK